MDITGTVKKAPKWAWYTVGGVALGAGALRIWKSRTTSSSADSTTANDATPNTSDMGNLNYGTAGASPSGVIVPPVIVSGGGSSDQGGTGLADLQGTYLGGVDALLASFQGLFDSVGGLVVDQNGSIIDLATAGSAPLPASSQPVVVATPTPVPAPSPAPSPVATGSSSQPTTTSAACPGSYPHHNPKNGSPSKKSCFKIDCRKKSEWHVYQDGHEVHDGDKC